MVTDDWIACQEEKAAEVVALEQQLEERDNHLAQMLAQKDLVQDDLEELQFMNDELLQRNQNLEAEHQASKVSTWPYRSNSRPDRLYTVRGRTIGLQVSTRPQRSNSWPDRLVHVYRG